MRTFRNQFSPGYLPDALAKLVDDELLIDTSWGNNVSPSFEFAGKFNLWVDHDDPEQREIGGEKFRVYRADAVGGDREAILETDDLAELLKFLAYRPVKTLEEAQAHFAALHAAGNLYHPDDSAESIVNTTDGARVFSNGEAARLDEQMNDIRALGCWEPWGGYASCPCGWINAVLDPHNVKPEREALLVAVLRKFIDRADPDVFAEELAEARGLIG